MKISIIGPTYPFRGGIAHYTTLLCKALQKKHQVQFISYTRQYPTLIFPGTTDKDPSRKPLLPDRVDYIIDSINPLTWTKAAKTIISFKPDILLLPWWVVFWVPQYYVIVKRVKQRTGAKIIFLCHNVVEHEANFLKVVGSRMVLKLGDRILTHSEAETQKVKQLLGSQAPVETAFHPSYAELDIPLLDKDAARVELGLTSRHVLLFFGFVRAYKGLDLLLNALPLILKNCKDLTLIVAGEFWQGKKNYLKQIDRLKIKNNVLIIDKYVPNEEVGLYFAATDLVVQPYRSVTGSGVCQLAYGLSRPVIASNCGSLADVIQDGRNGRLINVEDPGELAQAVIDSLIPATLSTLNQGAMQTKKHFSWERLVNLIVETAT